MDNHNYEETHIIRFLRNEMGSEEKEAFEKALAESTDLQRELAFHRQIMKGLDLNLRENTKEYLKSFEQQGESTGYRKIIGLSKVVKAACLFIVILVSGYLVYTAFFQSPGNKALAENHFEPYPNQLTNITRSTEEKSYHNYIDRAMRHYSAGEYGEAIPLFKKAISKDKANGLASFYLGNAYLADGKSKKAVQILKGNQKSLPNEYEVKNEWYLALAYLANDQEKDALSHLKEICKKGNDFYCQKGQKIIKSIQ